MTNAETAGATATMAATNAIGLIMLIFAKNLVVESGERVRFRLSESGSGTA